MLSVRERRGWRCLRKRPSADVRASDSASQRPLITEGDDKTHPSYSPSRHVSRAPPDELFPSPHRASLRRDKQGWLQAVTSPWRVTCITCVTSCQGQQPHSGHWVHVTSCLPSCLSSPALVHRLLLMAATGPHS